MNDGRPGVGRMNSGRVGEYSSTYTARGTLSGIRAGSGRVQRTKPAESPTSSAAVEHRRRVTRVASKSAPLSGGRTSNTLRSNLSSGADKRTASQRSSDRGSVATATPSPRPQRRSKRPVAGGAGRTPATTSPASSTSPPTPDTPDADLAARRLGLRGRAAGGVDGSGVALSFEDGDLMGEPSSRSAELGLGRVVLEDVDEYQEFSGGESEKEHSDSGEAESRLTGEDGTVAIARAAAAAMGMAPRSSDFETLESLGKGTYGQVYRVRRRVDGAVMVLKQVSMQGLSDSERKDALNEAEVMSQIQHQHVIRYYSSFLEDDTLSILMEYAPGGDLGQTIKRAKASGTPLSEDLLWDYLIQICSGLKHIHEQRILHRDIKPQNIFLDAQGTIKIGDFGLGRILGPNSAFARTAVGTPLYFSPELCQSDMYNERSDMWALGCLIYELATLSPPFMARNQIILSKKIVNEKPRPLPKRYSMQLQFLVIKLLEKDMSRRPDAAQVLKYGPVKLKIEQAALFVREQQLAEQAVALQSRTQRAESEAELAKQQLEEEASARRAAEAARQRAEMVAIELESQVSQLRASKEALQDRLETAEGRAGELERAHSRGLERVRRDHAQELEEVQLEAAAALESAQQEMQERADALVAAEVERQRRWADAVREKAAEAEQWVQERARDIAARAQLMGQWHASLRQTTTSVRSVAILLDESAHKDAPSPGGVLEAALSELQAHITRVDEAARRVAVSEAPTSTSEAEVTDESASISPVSSTVSATPQAMRAAPCDAAEAPLKSKATYGSLRSGAASDAGVADSAAAGELPSPIAPQRMVALSADKLGLCSPFSAQSLPQFDVAFAWSRSDTETRWDNRWRNRLAAPLNGVVVFMRFSRPVPHFREIDCVTEDSDDDEGPASVVDFHAAGEAAGEMLQLRVSRPIHVAASPLASRGLDSSGGWYVFDVSQSLMGLATIAEFRLRVTLPSSIEVQLEELMVLRHDRRVLEIAATPLHLRESLGLRVETHGADDDRAPAAGAVNDGRASPPRTPIYAANSHASPIALSPEQALALLQRVEQYEETIGSPLARQRSAGSRGGVAGNPASAKLATLQHSAAHERVLFAASLPASGARDRVEKDARDDGAPDQVDGASD